MANEGVTEVGSQAVANVLAHAGVKGMKWGVRRSQKQLDSAAGRKPAKTETKKEDVKSLSDADLRAKLNRLQMEKQYKDLTKAPPGKSAAGKKFATEVLREVAKQTVVAVGKSHSMKVAEKYMAKP